MPVSELYQMWGLIPILNIGLLCDLELYGPEFIISSSFLYLFLFVFLVWGFAWLFG